MRARFGWIVFASIILISIVSLWKFPLAFERIVLPQFQQTGQSVNRTDREIQLVSEFPGYRLEKSADFSAFEEYLDSMHFWDSGAIVDSNPSQPSTATSLRIVFTDKPQNGDRQMMGSSLEGLQEVSSAFVTSRNGEVTVSVHVKIDVAAANAMKQPTSLAGRDDPAPTTFKPSTSTS